MPLTDDMLFTIQRFEHSTGYHKKISTFVSFPEELDMTPFMSSSRNHNNGYSEQVIRESASCLSSENKYVTTALLNLNFPFFSLLGISRGVFTLSVSYYKFSGCLEISPSISIPLKDVLNLTRYRLSKGIGRNVDCIEDTLHCIGITRVVQDGEPSMSESMSRISGESIAWGRWWWGQLKEVISRQLLYPGHCSLPLNDECVFY